MDLRMAFGLDLQRTMNDERLFQGPSGLDLEG